MSKAIKIQNVSKQYRLGLVGTGTLSHDLKRWWTINIRRKEDPYLMIGETNVRDSKGESQYVWALKDINLEVQQGEVLGIIGKNGAGKSTLLKLLSRVTKPTTGHIHYKGRIASLLEVGTGFHPEFTGLENIYMNGAIMGMTRAEIKSKLDEIISFAGVERYIDTPVKRYSSGMRVRLGFSIAAHLEPDILVVDEVLAVGDAEFQKKAIGKMQDVSKGSGRTVLFVSHNMTSIENLCSRVCVIDNGSIVFSGDPNEGIKYYLNSSNSLIEEDIATQISRIPWSDEFNLINCSISQNMQTSNYEFLSNMDIEVNFEYEVLKKLTGLRVGFDIISFANNSVLFRSYHDENEDDVSVIKPGKYTSIGKIPKNLLKEGTYILKLSIGLHMIKGYVFTSVKVKFVINNIAGINKNYADSRPGIIMPYIKWETNKL
jgi:lipopolysaccharide transport system ATP-binding protein